MIRHVSEDEAHAAVARARREATIITDAVAATIASWWHSPAPADESLTKLSHGIPLTAEDYPEIIDATASNTLAAHAEDERNGQPVGGPQAMALVALSHWAVARKAGRDHY